MANVKFSESRTKAFFLDMLHAARTISARGSGMPLSAYFNRDVYEIWCFERGEREARQAIKRLKQQKLLSIREKGEKIIIELTEKGEIERLKLQILQEKIKLPKNVYCLVSFDVPEATRRTRSFFRNFLKTAEFERVHHSLWKSDRDLIEPMRELVRVLGSEDWIKVYQATE